MPAPCACWKNSLSGSFVLLSSTEFRGPKKILNPEYIINFTITWLLIYFLLKQYLIQPRLLTDTAEVGLELPISYPHFPRSEVTDV